MANDEFVDNDIPHDLRHLRSVKVKKAAEILDFDEKTIRRMIESGDLEAHGRNHRLRVLVRSIDGYQGRERR